MKLKIAAGLIVLLLVALTVFYLLNAPSSREISYPSPNGFDAVTEAGRKMTLLPLDFDSTQDTGALRTYLDANADALALMNQASDQEYLIRMPNDQSMDEILEESGLTRNAARLLYVEARLAELEGRSTDAADALTKIAVIGRRSANGGLMIHQLMAIAIERLGLEGLMQLAQKLSADEKNSISKLIQADDKTDPPIDEKIDSIKFREQENTKRQNGTFVGSFLLWQLSDTEMIKTQYESLHNEIVKIQSLRNELVESLASSQPNVPLVGTEEP